MKALTLHQPWAQLVALGVKTIETRSWATSYRGPLVIQAAKRAPAHIREVPLSAEGAALYDALATASGHSDYGWLPLGAIVASCTLVDVVPIKAEIPPHPEQPPFAFWYGSNLQIWRNDGSRIWALPDKDVAAQLPYGNFAPSRFAWLLEGIKPVEERCPACWGAGTTAPIQNQIHGVFRAQPFGPQGTGVPACPTCAGNGKCDPIPAKGKQRIWEWVA